MKLLQVVGARPNYMKIAPIMSKMLEQADRVQQVLVHTGQHYDAKMSDVFFHDLGLPLPDHYLGVGSGSHAEQTARVMMTFEPVIRKENPHLVLVAGDVNSTFACALVCAKLCIPIGHVEAGLRSFDRSMPEEINRVLTDQISKLLFITSPEAEKNLIAEGIQREKIYYVGNTMIDTLIRLLPRTTERWSELQQQLNLDRYVLVTLHRPSNVDDPNALTAIMTALDEVSRDVPVIFPVHPRTRDRLYTLKIDTHQINLLDPLGYLDFLALQQHSSLVITDSGGVQEETSVLGVPCLTLRNNTERPITIELGTNRLVPCEKSAIIAAAQSALSQNETKKVTIPLWDGHAAERIVKSIIDWHSTQEAG